MSHNNGTHDSTVTGINNCDSGMIHVPAQVQRDEGICIDATVEVTLSDIPDAEFIDSVSFQGTQIGGDSVTVPARLMRKLGLDGGETVTASFEKVEDDADDESEETLDKGAQDADDGESDESSDFEEMLDDVMDDGEQDEDEQEEEGLGELFA